MIAINTMKNVQLSLDVQVVVKLLDLWGEAIYLLIEQLVVLIVPNQNKLLDDASNINININTLLFLVKREEFSYLLSFSNDIPAFMICCRFKDSN
ncbi:MAG TPA: hypothetical protein VFG90_12510 [Nitrososphaeraceae archaeon]|nr:hypothetical protein [Nitrososphaeraceae archaeon]